MALITKATSPVPSLSSLTPPQGDQFQLDAGEAIAAGDLCYIASDGTAMLSNGTSANAAAKCVGFAAKAAASGAPVTLYRNQRMHYASGMTPGAQLYVGTTAGRIDTAATTGGTAPIGFVIDATRVYIHGSHY